MAKSCLVDFQGNIQHICEPGDEFEIYEGPNATIRWVNCANDDVNDSWVLDNGNWVQNVQAPPSYTVLRRNAYGDIGMQLDMMYKDQINGTSTWKDHVARVKATVPSPNSEEAIEVRNSRQVINWGTPESPAWTDTVNREIPGVTRTIGKKISD